MAAKTTEEIGPRMDVTLLIPRRHHERKWINRLQELVRHVR
jgi:hypothetical protein